VASLIIYSQFWGKEKSGIKFVVDPEATKNYKMLIGIKI
jgi:hypothetical protein